MARDTLRSFLNSYGSHCRWKILTIRCATVRLMPVLRLRDARFMRRIRNAWCPMRRMLRSHGPDSWIFWRVSWRPGRKI